MNKIIEVDPSDELTFGMASSSSSSSQQNSNISQLNLKNISIKKIAFKIKTTAPSNYFVKPNQGQLDPQQKIIIDIKMHPKILKDNEQLNDKFLIQAIELDSSVYLLDSLIKLQNMQSFQNLWKEIPEDKMLQLRLKVKIDSNFEPQPRLNQSQGNDLYYSQLQQSKAFPSQVKATPIQKFDQYQQIEKKVTEQEKQVQIQQIQNGKVNYKEKLEAMTQKVEDQEKFLLKLTEERNKYQERYSKMKIQYKKNGINSGGFGLIQIFILLIIANIVGSYLGK